MLSRADAQSAVTLSLISCAVALFCELINWVMGGWKSALLKPFCLSPAPQYFLYLIMFFICINTENVCLGWAMASWFAVLRAMAIFIVLLSVLDVTPFLRVSPLLFVMVLLRALRAGRFILTGTPYFWYLVLLMLAMKICNKVFGEKGSGAESLYFFSNHQTQVQGINSEI